MPREVKSYESWQAVRPRAQAWAEKVLRALPTTRRERPRDPDEARLLRNIGTPERQPGDLVVSVPVAPGALLVEKVGREGGLAWREFLDSDANLLQGLWGPDPQAYIDELRGPWPEEDS